jgi:hypothetical protein
MFLRSRSQDRRSVNFTATTDHSANAAANDDNDDHDDHAG